MANMEATAAAAERVETDTRSIANCLEHYAFVSTDPKQRRPMDIAGVVMEVSVNRTFRTAQIIFSDPSLSNHGDELPAPVASLYCARVWLKGPINISMILEQNIARGDVLRFNRLTVSKDNNIMHLVQAASTRTSDDPRKNFQTPQRQQQSRIVCEFQHSWRDPEAGPSWTRLCSIQQDGSAVYPEDHLLEKHMATPQSIIQSLVDWCSEHSFVSDTIYSSRSGQPQQRSLADIFTKGRMSHVIVRILSCDGSIVTPLTNNNNNNLRKRHKRSSNATTATSCIAMVSDEYLTPSSQTVMALYECRKWETLLKGAVREKSLVRLTNLLSVSTSDGEIVLVPTSESLFLLLGDSYPVPQQRRRLLPSPSIEPLSQYPQDSDDGDGDDSLSLVALLEKVYIEDLDVSLGQDQQWLDTEELLSVLIDIPNREDNDRSTTIHYRPSILTVRGVTNNGQLLEVHADSNVMQTLCGSVSANLVVEQNSLRTHVFDLMKALLREDLELHWHLRRINESSFRVSAVTILKL